MARAFARPRSQFDRSNPPPVWDVRIGDAIEEYPYCCWVDEISPDGCLEPPDLAGQGGGRWDRIQAERPELHAWANAIVRDWGYGQEFKRLANQTVRNRVVCAMLVRSRAAHDYLFGLRAESTALAAASISSVIGLIGTILTSTSNPVLSAIGGALLGGAALVSAGAEGTINRIAERLASGEEPSAGDVDPCEVANAILLAGGVVLDTTGAIVQDGGALAGISDGLDAVRVLLSEGCEDVNVCDVLRALLATGNVVVDTVQGTIEVKKDASQDTVDTVQALVSQYGSQILDICDATQGPSSTPPEGPSAPADPFADARSRLAGAAERSRTKGEGRTGGSSIAPLIGAALGFYFGGPLGAAAGYYLLEKKDS